MVKGVHSANKLLVLISSRQFSGFHLTDKELKFLEPFGRLYSKTDANIRKWSCQRATLCNVSKSFNWNKKANSRSSDNWSNYRREISDIQQSQSNHGDVHKSSSQVQEIFWSRTKHNSVAEDTNCLQVKDNENNFLSSFSRYNFVSLDKRLRSVIGAAQGTKSFVSHKMTNGVRNLEDWILRDVHITDPEIFMNFDDMVEAHGYHMEPHEIQTEDGYILSLMRISKRRPSSTTNSSSRSKNIKPAVLLVHGFQCSAVSWFLNNPQNILPYMLVDEGYDCWVANLRGTPLSKLHTSLSNDSSKFWDFSWEEMGFFDIPALIDYILEATQNSKLNYIGHSMGCTVFFVAMSMKPEFCSKIEAMVALGPAVYGKYLRNLPLKFCVAPIASLIGKVDFLSHQELFKRPFAEHAKILCPPLRSPERIGGYIGRKYGIFFGGLGTDQIEESRIAKIAAHWPQSTSVKAMCHGMQCLNSRRFERFDYGDLENHKRYGQMLAPLYDLTKVSTPVALFYSNDDEICTTHDVTQLSKDLPNVIGNYEISQLNFTHGDFIFGKDAHSLVYEHIIQIFQKSSPTVSSHNIANMEELVQSQDN